MLLEKLYMYRKHDKSFYGAAEFAGDVGKIELSLNDEQCKKILSVMGEALIETAKDTAKLLTLEVIDAVNNSKQLKA